MKDKDLSHQTLNASDRGAKKFKPSKRFYIGCGLALILVALFGWLPAIYTLQIAMPPFEQLNRTEGNLSFTENVPRYGYQVILSKDDGTADVFSCRTWIFGAHNCLDRKYAGKRAVIWWHTITLHPMETNKHAVQIAIDNEVVLSHQRTLGKLAASKAKMPWMVSFYFIALVASIIFGLWLERRNRG